MERREFLVENCQKRRIIKKEKSRSEGEGCALGEYDNAALDAVREYARMNHKEQKTYLKRICEEAGIDAAGLHTELAEHPITINFLYVRHTA